MRTRDKNRKLNYRTPTAVITFLLMMLFGPFSNAQQSLLKENILIIYFSRTGNTKTVAEMIQEKVGGTLVELVKKDPYPENYQKIVDQVDRENDEGFLPELETRISNLKDYDTIFFGFPTWDMQMPPPMKSFLSENDLCEKVIIPFNTNAGFGVGSGFDQLKEYCPDSKILEGFIIEGGFEKKGIFLAIKNYRAIQVEREIEKWLNTLKIN